VLDEPRETAGERLRHAGLHQVRGDYPQPSSSSVLTLGTIGAPQESQVTCGARTPIVIHICHVFLL